MRATSCLDRSNAFGIESFVANEELTILSCKNIVRHCGDTDPIAKLLAQSEHQRCFAAPDRTANADGESALAQVPVKRLVSLMKMPGMLHVLMGVAAGPVMMVMMGHI